MSEKLSFSSDYMDGACPEIMHRLMETNLEQTVGYGLDPYSEAAKEKIRKACNAPDAEIFFLVGGTQTNATVIDALLQKYQGVLAAETGHISVHEAGAIEAGGHKVLSLPQKNGKVSASSVRSYLENFYNDANNEHMVMPGMLYISQPTEYGTLYSKAELSEIKAVCSEYRIPLYADGARLAYALGCPENDVALEDLAAMCDVFYIGGTKCGALFGEAVVIPKKGLIPHFFTIIKQHGALLAKGRILGLQFDTLFTDNLYRKIGENAIKTADRIREILEKNGFPLCFDSPTNQVFCIAENAILDKLSSRVEYGFWEHYDDTHTRIRFVTGWATTMEQVERLEKILVSTGTVLIDNFLVCQRGRF